MYAAKLERIFRASKKRSGRMETSETEVQHDGTGAGRSVCQRDKDHVGSAAKRHMAKTRLINIFRRKKMFEDYRKTISARGMKIVKTVMREPASRRVFMARAVKELLLGKELDLGNLKGEAKRGAYDAYNLMQTMFGVVEIYETGAEGEKAIKRARLMRACPAVYAEVRDL